MKPFLASPSTRLLIQLTDKLYQRHLESPAHSQQGRNSDRPSGLNLLPVTGRESKADHVFLTQPVSRCTVDKGMLRFSEQAFKEWLTKATSVDLEIESRQRLHKTNFANVTSASWAGETFPPFRSCM